MAIKTIKCPLCGLEISSSTLSKSFNSHLRSVHKFDIGSDSYISFLKDTLYPSLGINTGYCEICGSPTEFLTIVSGFKKYCSKSCANTGRYQKSVATWNKKYGCNHPLQSESILAKQKKTNLERYGSESVFTSDIVLEKIKSTNLERYGSENPSQSEIIKQKKSETSLKNYGVDCTLKSPEIRDKIRQTNLGKYGHTCYLHSEVGIQSKVDKWNEIYGVSHPMQSDDVKNKVRDTCISKYGVENVFLSTEVKSKIFSNKRRDNFNTFVELLANKNIEVLFDVNYFSDYNTFINSDSSTYLYRCTKCNLEFTTHASFPQLVYCKKCSNSISNFHYDVISFLKSLSISNMSINHRILYSDSSHPKELDIHLPDFNLAIECDGLYWHSDQYYDSTYHLSKTNMCKDLGIRLLHITDSEWYNKQDICKSIILSALGKNNRIYARQCNISEISSSEYNNFCNLNHISGSVPASVRIGLFYNNQLVQVCGFGKSRFKEDETELLRHCSLLGYTIVGGFSRIIKHYVDKYSPNNLITYCDNRLFTGSGYLNTRWELLYTTSPNYWYFSQDEYYLQSRIKYQKHKLKELLPVFDPDMTEYENMQMNGYMRYYDCGNLKLKYIYK